jgi:hypothetical protein
MVMLAAFDNAVGLNPQWDHGKPHGVNQSLGLNGGRPPIYRTHFSPSTNPIFATEPALI